eukprot:1158351-Pelagomonas_calceolata.AAC.1
MPGGWGCPGEGDKTFPRRQDVQQLQLQGKKQVKNYCQTQEQGDAAHPRQQLRLHSKDHA